MTDIKEDPSANSEKEYWEGIDINDCDYLLRSLEREAYTSVVNAFRAKGPPSEHIFLLLEHLRSALAINIELGHAEIRRAAVDPKLCKIADVLNPNYDTVTEWLGCSAEGLGEVEHVPCRGKPFAGTSSSSIVNQLLKDAAACNEKLNRTKGRVFELLANPPKPFVPERLRMLLRETDRPEQRIPPPLETPSPLPAPTPIEDRSARSEERPPPAKKRRQRTSKGAKNKENPPKLMPEKEEKKDEEMASTSTAAPAYPVTPVAATTANVSSSPLTGSTGSNTIISPGQPPQSGDAMKTWVSKIHEQELAASAKKNGSEVLSLEEPSTSYDSSEEPVTKKKRRSKHGIVDSYYLNSCARTRPFQSNRVDTNSGTTNQIRESPEKRSASKAFCCAESAASQTAGPSATPVAPSLTPFATPSRRKTMDEEATANYLVMMAESGAASTSAAGYSGLGTRPAISTNVQKSPIHALVPRAPPRYLVNKSGVVGGSPATPSTVRAPSNVGGIGGRTASLGSQQLHATTSNLQFVSQKASSSNSTSSLSSTGGGSMGSAIGASSSCSSVLTSDPHQSATALPPESAGHDYGVNYSTAPVMDHPMASNGRVLDPTGALRSTPRVMGRDRWTNTSIRPPGAASSQPVYNGMTMLPSQLRAAGSGAMRPRLGSRGAAPAVVTAGVVQSGERASDGTIQAIVHNIHLETAQKESANGKRTTVMPNGVLNHQSASSTQHMQSIHPYTASRPSTSSNAAVPSSSMVGSGPVSQSVPPPPILTGLPPAPQQLSTTIASQSPSSSLSFAVPSSTGLFGATGPSTSTALAGPSTSKYPHDPAFAALLNNAMNAIKKEGGSGPLTDRLNNAVATLNIVIEPKQQQQQSPAAPVVPPRSAQRQYVLQPQGLPGGYAEFKPDNPLSYKSFAPDGTPVEYGVSPEELYDQRVIAPPSTSGMTGGGSGGAVGGMMRPHQLSTLPFPILQQSHVATTEAATASRLGIPSSYSIPSTSKGVVHDNGQMLMTNRGVPSYLPPPLQRHLDDDAAASQQGGTSSDAHDILEQSCRELR